MKVKFIIASVSALFLAATVASAQSQDKKQPDLQEICEKEADRLESLLDLEPWQTFRVDSTLKHNLQAMTDEIEEMKAAKVSNADIYMQIQDRWYDRVDESYRKIFTAEQWRLYLKQGAARLQKARDKRRQKLEQPEAVKKKK